MLIRICCICFRVLQQGVVDDSLASHFFHDVRAQIHLVVFSYRVTITFSFATPIRFLCRVRLQCANT